VKYHLPLTDPVLQTVDVSVNLGGLQILDSVSIGVPEGTITGLIGPNGAGKTTVFNVICGFVHADSGVVRLDGKKLRKIHTHQLTDLGIARTLQGVGLFPTLTALDNVVLGASHQDHASVVESAIAAPWRRRQQIRIEEKARALLDELAIGDIADRYPGELPYPIQKRVALARALVSDPKVLLLDEPAGGISDADMEDLANLLRSWVPRMSILLVEHHMELVMQVTDLIWVLDAGKVISAGTPEFVRNDPAVLAAYLGDEGALHA